jgi:hypothetical protein
MYNVEDVAADDRVAILFDEVKAEEGARMLARTIARAEYLDRAMVVNVGWCSVLVCFERAAQDVERKLVVCWLMRHWLKKLLQLLLGLLHN